MRSSGISLYSNRTPKLDSLYSMAFINNKSIIPLSEIKGISGAQILNFKEKDIISATDFLESDKEILLSVKGIGEKTIEKITNSINDYLESQSNSVEDVKE